MMPQLWEVGSSLGPILTKACFHLTGQGGVGGKAMKGLGWPSYGAGNPPQYLVWVRFRISCLPTVMCELTCFQPQVWVWEPPEVWVSLSWPGTKSQAVSGSWDTKNRNFLNCEHTNFFISYFFHSFLSSIWWKRLQRLWGSTHGR